MTSSPVSPERVLHIDIETYCEEELSKCGVHRYAAHPSFEILLIGRALGDNPVNVWDPPTLGKTATPGNMPNFVKLLQDPQILKAAHNAAFEMTCLAAAGFPVLPEQWADTMALANYAALPPSLAALTDMLRLGERGKLSVGTQLVTYFCKPCKPTKANGGRTRNTAADDPEAWETFVEYNRRDVEAEREVYKRLTKYDQTPHERRICLMDYEINRRGIRVDAPLAEAAVTLSGRITETCTDELKQITGLSNPNSVPQFKQFLAAQGYETETFTKADAEAMLADRSLPPQVRRAVELKMSISKAAVKKYDAMLRACCPDGTVKGMFQYYGSRTGRWAGRLVQLQNLRRNSLPDLDVARTLARDGDLEGLELAYDDYDTSEILGQLVRTAFIPSPGRKFIVADFSAIEARVIAWLAREKWRQDVFAADGDIYKSSYSQAFGVPVEQVDKAMRQKGKIMELALGFGGSVGAMKKFGADKLGLGDEELQGLVSRWRRTSPKIPALWDSLNSAALAALSKGSRTKIDRGVEVGRDGNALSILLPSGRSLYYQDTRIEDTPRGPQIIYWDLNQTSRHWEETRTYGGKLSENVVQAVARDCLADAMLRLTAAGYEIVSHIHDEVIIDAEPDARVEDVERIMGRPEPWGAELHLTAKGYEGPYYFKD